MATMENKKEKKTERKLLVWWIYF